MSAANWNEAVDEILDRLVDDVFGLHSVSAKAKVKAKAAITAAVKEHVIGNNVPYENDERIEAGRILNIPIKFQNQLRAEQRRALELREEKG